MKILFNVSVEKEDMMIALIPTVVYMREGKGQAINVVWLFFDLSFEWGKIPD